VVVVGSKEIPISLAGDDMAGEKIVGNSGDKSVGGRAQSA
jgi:hypothetical protein